MPVCSLTLKKLAVTIPEAEKSLGRKERRRTLKFSLLGKDGETKEKFRKKFSNCQLSESQSACYQNAIKSAIIKIWETRTPLHLSRTKQRNAPILC